MGFAFYLFFMALTYLRPIEAFAPDLVVYRPMLVLLLLVFLVGLNQRLVTHKMAASGQDLRVLFAFTAAIAVSVAATGWIGGIPEALIDFAPSVLMFLATVMLVTNTRRLKATCATLVISILILSIAGAAAYHTGFLAEKLVIWQSIAGDDDIVETEFGMVPADDNSGERLWRIRSLGFLNDPNDFGQAIVVALPMLFMFYRKRQLLRNLLLVGLPSMMMLYAIYLTNSRGTLLGLGSLVFFSIRRMLGTMRTAVLVALLIVGAIALNFTGGRGYTANEESAGGRIDAWSEGLQMFIHRPLFGVGYHGFIDNHTHTAHNSFVLCFAETGLLGYFFWLGLIILVFKQLSRAADLSRPDSEGKRWAMALRSSMLGFFTCAFFLSRSYEPGLFILLSLALAAWYSAREHVEPAAIPQLMAPIAWKRTALIVAAGSILTIYLIVIVKNLTIGRSV